MIYFELNLFENKFSLNKNLRSSIKKVHHGYFMDSLMIFMVYIRNLIRSISDTTTAA